jgi:nitrous oxidase accessory protein NosD
MKGNIISVIFGAIGFTVPAFSTIINIPADYPTIQTGINASSYGDTVLVQPGTYVENINFNGHNIVLGSLFLTTGDTTYISETVIDGDSIGRVITFESGETGEAIVCGFTLQNGLGLGGGGIYCEYASPTIANNIICGNRAYELAEGYGGGIDCYQSSAVIIDNIILGNSAYHTGGGIHCNLSNTLISNNIISENYANDGGAGIVIMYSSDIILNNIITGNSTSGNAGGILDYHTNSIIAENVVAGNSAGHSGGGELNAITLMQLWLII